MTRCPPSRAIVFRSALPQFGSSECQKYRYGNDSVEEVPGNDKILLHNVTSSF